MKAQLLLKFLLLFLAVIPSASIAQPYFEIAPARIKIDTPAATSHPWVADFRLGYDARQHQIELALMAGIKDDNVNQLSTEVTSVGSLFYQYITNPESSLKLHLIIGASVIDIESNLPGVGKSKDDFHGVSYGFGLEESFRSMPELKISVDWIQLYHGEDLDISTISLGIHYEF